MGATGVKLFQRLRILLGAGVLVGLIALVGGAGPAWATGTCNPPSPYTVWTGAANDDWFNNSNWTGGVPDSSHNACFNSGANVIISGAAAQAASITLYGATLTIRGGTNSTEGSLTVANGDASSIDPTSSVVLSDSCSTACTPAGSALTISAGTLDNAGTITADPGSAASSGRTLLGNVDNIGTIALNTILTVPDGSGTATITNGTGGLISNGGGSGYLEVVGPNTFEQGAGTTDPATANPAHPAVVLDGSPGLEANLDYTGTGASTIAARDQDTLAGSLAAGQNLVVDGSKPACQEALSTASGSFSNAGTITLGGSGCSGLETSSGTLSNAGTIVADTTGSNVTREIRGSLTNSGTLDINGDTAFDGSGATLTQTAGTTRFGTSGQTLDLTGSNGTFSLQGGLLEGGGQTSGNSGTAAFINGNVNNTGGNLMPGSSIAPGLMTFGGTYAQGPGGRLTEVIDGTHVGTGYSQLDTTGSSTIGGTLAIDTLSRPGIGSLYTLLGASSVTGKFAHLIGHVVAGGTRGYKALYDAQDVTLEGAALARLTVQRAGSGSGTVTSSPSGINCGSRCTASYFEGQTVMLSEHPAAGWAFNGWSGACSGFASTCSVTMSQARTVTASFARPTTTSLTSSRNRVHRHRKVTYTAMVSPVPDGGTVKFTDNGRRISGCGAQPVSAGRATCSVRYGTSGIHRIQATYSGDPSFAHSISSPLTERVRR